MGGIVLLYQEYFLLMIPALALSTLDWGAMREKPLSDGLEKAQTRTDSALARLVSGTAREIRVPVALVRAALRGPGKERSSCLRWLWFLLGVAVGLMACFAYNDLRFGSFFDSGKMRNFSHRHPVWGNPIAGLLTLLISPGKSVFLYSPPLVLGLLGIRSLWRRRPGSGSRYSECERGLGLVHVLLCGGRWGLVLGTAFPDKPASAVGAGFSLYSYGKS